MADNIVDLRRTNFTIVSNTVIDSPELTKPVELAVYLILCRHAGNKTRESYLKVATIAKEARSSDRVVRYALKELQKAGFIEIKPNHRADGGRMHNTYTLLNV